MVAVHRRNGCADILAVVCIGFMTSGADELAVLAAGDAPAVWPLAGAGAGIITVVKQINCKSGASQSNAEGEKGHQSRSDLADSA